MAERQTIKDDGSLDKYASVIPHMADDDLDPFQMRLYIHYKKMYALHGECDESVRDTAKLTRMSSYAVQKARDELAELGYIKVVKPTKEEARKGKTVHVTLVDRWAENVSRYAKAVSNLTQPTPEGVLKSTQPVSNLTQQTGEPVSDLPQEAVSNLTRIDSSSKDSLKDVKTTNDSAPVENLLIFLSQKDPNGEYNRPDLEKLIKTYGEVPLRDALEAAINKPADNPVGYAVTVLKAGGVKQRQQPPPSVPPVPPNGNGAKPSQASKERFEAEARRVRLQNEMEARKKASGE
jgi:hypothetical protein